MKILYLLPTLLHPHMLTSGYLRHYHFIRQLSQQHDITLLVLSRAAVSPEALDAMSLYTKRTVTVEVPGVWAKSAIRPWAARLKVHKRVEQAIARRLAIREMKQQFLRLVEEEPYDVVVLHGKDLAPIVEDWNGLPLVIDFGDATSLRIQQSMRYASITEFPWRALRYLEVKLIEKKLLNKTPYLAFISGRDQEVMRRQDRRSRVIPNGVDLEYWCRQTPQPDSHCLVYTGVMSYPANADGACFLMQDVLPHLKRALPNMQVFIVGRDPTPDVLQLAQQHPEVTVTGFVDDVRPYLEQATVYVAPLRFASGMQNKLLEALAMKIPVVTTPIAAAGLQTEDGISPPVVVAEGGEQIAAGVLRLLGNAQERAYLADAGRHFVEQHFSWFRSAKKLEHMCFEAIEPHHNRLPQTVSELPCR